MLQLKNQTPFEGLVVPLPDADGVDCILTLVKATFGIGDQVFVADQQQPIVLADEYFDEPTSSSLKYSSDIALNKLGTDVVLLGHAYAPRGEPVKELDVAFSIGELHKRVRVFGNRSWTKDGRVSPAESFVRLPITYEQSFGGVDDFAGDELVSAKNPVGKGLMLPKRQRCPEGCPLPNIEFIDTLISSPSDQPEPAAFGPIPPHWAPRREFAGTYDDQWQSSRSPYLPLDFDIRFFQSVPSDQVVPNHVIGGEQMTIEGMRADGRPLSFRLPTVGMEVVYQFDNSNEGVESTIDTVVVEPDRRQLTMTWRSILRCDKKTLRLREVLVAASRLEPSHA